MSNLAPDDAARKKRRHRNERIVAAIVVLLVTVVTVGVIGWSQRLDRDFTADSRYIPKATSLTPEHELLRELVRIDTSTPAGAAEGARWIAAYLQRHGVAAELIQSAPERLNVYARIKGEKPGEGLLLFNHIDVVPAKASEWMHPPFSAAVAMNSIVGRGTLDMKALTICQLLAFVDVARSGRMPRHDLVFLATADEETGSQYGMQWIIANRRDVFDNVRYGITEGGITEMMSDRMTYFGIETGGKQLVELTLAADDLATASRVRMALEPLMFPREPERVLPGVRRYFADVAPTRVAFKPLLADIDTAIREGNFWRLHTSYRDLTQNSVWISAPYKSGHEFRMWVRLVNLPDEQPDARIAALLKAAARHGGRLGRVVSKNGPVPLSTPDTPLFAILQREAARRYKVEAGTVVLFRSSTDARFLRPLGIICYGLAPYPITYFQSTSIHGKDERIGIDHFLDGVAYIRRATLEWALGAA
jgi:acetylornithine deacetylase/succinyl-diaminopimelate desuccinylase-like protein